MSRYNEVTRQYGNDGISGAELIREIASKVKEEAAKTGRVLHRMKLIPGDAEKLYYSPFHPITLELLNAEGAQKRDFVFTQNKSRKLHDYIVSASYQLLTVDEITVLRVKR